MSSYADLKLGPFVITSSRNDIDPTAMSLFRENDKKVHRGTFKRLLSKYSHDYDFERYNNYEDSDKLTIMYYSAPVSTIRDRLELMGFTYERARHTFERNLKREIMFLEDYDLRYHRRELRILRNLTFDMWIENLGVILRKRLPPIRRYDKPKRRISPVLRYILTHSEEQYGFLGDDFRHFIRILCSIVDSHSLIYDLTDLNISGYVSESDNLVDYAEYLIQKDFPIAKRIVVLTEGCTDNWILQRSFKLLYPHLIDYFHFLDLRATKTEGGAGFLANIVKAFAGAGIINRIIALFDNDTAAASWVRNLSKTKLPENIVVLRYPDIELARNYPTQGPAGIISMDVNGLAGSIELYLGTDVLYNDNSFVPIQWKGYDAKLNQYQGELADKIGIQKRFKKKLDDCELHPERLSDYDWTGLEAIFDVVYTAFHNL